jgi:putative hydrolase of the HAD superfamily
MVKAVIFDLDDTLISEKKYIESGYQHISKLLNNNYYKGEQDLYKILLGLFSESPKYVFNRILDKLGIKYTKEIIIDLVEEFRNHDPNIEFYHDVLPCLEYLKQKGVKVGIITDGYANSQRKKLEALKAYEHFDNIIVTDEYGRDYWKPHPRSFEEMRKQLNVDFDEMIYVGDNPEKDFYISIIYPIKTMRIYRGFSENGLIYKGKEYFKGVKEDYKIRTLEDILTIMHSKYNFR